MGKSTHLPLSEAFRAQILIISTQYPLESSAWVQTHALSSPVPFFMLCVGTDLCSRFPCTLFHTLRGHRHTLSLPLYPFSCFPWVQTPAFPFLCPTLNKRRVQLPGSPVSVPFFNKTYISILFLLFQFPDVSVVLCDGSVRGEESCLSDVH